MGVRPTVPEIGVRVAAHPRARVVVEVRLDRRSHGDQHRGGPRVLGIVDVEVEDGEPQRLSVQPDHGEREAVLVPLAGPPAHAPESLRELDVEHLHRLERTGVEQ